jgi:ribulose-phosphate 3-epimerase
MAVLPFGGNIMRKLGLEQSILIAPSILAADFARLADEIAAVEEAGAQVLNLDIMDGHFVPNISIGPPVVKSIRGITPVALDVHLMIENPHRYVDDFIAAGANWISVHVEADAHLKRTLVFIRERGARAGVAFNPGTPVSVLEEVLSDADYVLLMTVNPGFGGQEFIGTSLSKIAKLREAIAAAGSGARIEVDGGIHAGNLPEVLAAGAEIIVAGSSIFRSPQGAATAFREMDTVAVRYAKAVSAV